MIIIEKYNNNNKNIISKREFREYLTVKKEKEYNILEIYNTISIRIQYLRILYISH